MELIEKFQTTNKVNVPYVIAPRRDGDVARLVADNKKTKKLLDWEPKRNIERYVYRWLELEKTKSKWL